MIPRAGRRLRVGYASCADVKQSFTIGDEGVKLRYGEVCRRRGASCLSGIAHFEDYHLEPAYPRCGLIVSSSQWQK